MDRTVTALPSDLYLADDELELRVPGDMEAGRTGAPVYVLGIFRRGTGIEVGRMIVRLDPDDPGLAGYAGHVAFEVAPEHRGRRGALRATRLVAPLARRHGFAALWITTTPDNAACRRTLELLGAEYVDTVVVPEDSDMRALGMDRVCRYRWVL